LIPLVMALGLAACGGGGNNSLLLTSDESPSVTVTMDPTYFEPGDSVYLQAYVTDDDWIDHVDFYRVDGNVSTLLGTQRSPPYTLVTVAPTDGRANFSVFAVAEDGWGNDGTSPLVTRSR
jgi:hypothetical protein